MEQPVEVPVRERGRKRGIHIGSNECTFNAEYSSYRAESRSKKRIMRAPSDSLHHFIGRQAVSERFLRDLQQPKDRLLAATQLVRVPEYAYQFSGFSSHARCKSPDGCAAIRTVTTFFRCSPSPFILTTPTFGAGFYYQPASDTVESNYPL